jgi:L-asparaginase
MVRNATQRVFPALVFVVATKGVSAQQAKPPEVLVVATGGTIASTGNYYGDRGGPVNKISAEELTKAAPGIDKIATLSVEQFSNVASGAIGPRQWIDLARRINTVFRERPSLSGIVVTHGTDTMEETAYFLDLTVAGDRPVIVTGAMRPADAIGADGPANLFNAVRAAAAPASRGRGEMVLMDDRLFAAREVTKTNTTRVETFQAPEHGPLAIVDHDTIYYNRSRPTRRTPFDLSNVTELPRVDIVYSYGGADSVLIDAAVAAGAKGIVIAGVGAGGTTPGQSAALRRASEKGVIVVTGSRTGSGRVAGSLTRPSAGDLNVQKARILLMLALTRTQDRAEIAKIFNDYGGAEP